MAVSTPDKPSEKRGTARALVAVLIGIAVAAALGFGYASPYIALDRLKRAADARDVETVNQYVDFPALRESLKQQVSGLLTRKLGMRADGNPLAALGSMIGAALIGSLVDAYATPDGVAALLNGMPPRGEPGERPPSPPAVAQNTPNTPAAPPVPAQPETPPQPPQTTAGYRGINEFVVTYQHGIGDTRYAAILRREGLFSWKLAAVDLND